jgi:SpoIIAA-like
MIEALEGFPTNVAAFACHGHVTRQDYDSVLVPAVEKALEQNEKVRLYYETAGDFDGIDPGAILEDTMIGLSHASRWEKLAVVTDVNWIRHAILLFRFLIPGELRVYPSDEAAAAKAWIVA